MRGQDIPKPVKTWTQCGINIKVLDVLKKHGFERPLSIQAQVRSGWWLTPQLTDLPLFDIRLCLGFAM